MTSKHSKEYHISETSDRMPQICRGAKTLLEMMTTSTGGIPQNMRIGISQPTLMNLPQTLNLSLGDHTKIGNYLTERQPHNNRSAIKVFTQVTKTKVSKHLK